MNPALKAGTGQRVLFGKAPATGASEYCSIPTKTNKPKHTFDHHHVQVQQLRYLCKQYLYPHFYICWRGCRYPSVPFLSKYWLPVVPLSSYSPRMQPHPTQCLQYPLTAVFTYTALCLHCMTSFALCCEHRLGATAIQHSRAAPGASGLSQHGMRGNHPEAQNAPL